MLRRDLVRPVCWRWQGGFIMPIKPNELTKEMVMKAMQCKNADELIALAKSGGIELT